MTRLLTAAGVALMLAACTTTGSASAAEERAACARMAQTMGTATTHDHAQMKGSGADAMNTRHQRCQKVLADTK